MQGRKATIFYDSDCGLCLRTRRYLEPLDIFRTMEWIPYQSPKAARFGIPEEEMREHVQFVSGERRWSGFSAVKQVLLRLPPLYVAAAGLVAKYPEVALPIALFFSPLFQPAGDRLYDLVSHAVRTAPACRLRRTDAVR